MNSPDCWVLVEVKYLGETHVKILCSYYGGFANGDSWRISSAVRKIDVDGDVYRATTASGSEYVLHRGCYRMSSYMENIYTSLQEEIQRVNSPGNSLQIIDLERFGSVCYN